MEAVAENFIDEVETLRDNDMDEEERAIVMEKFMNMYETQDLYAVSYTHLDVYKRQGEDLDAIQMNYIRTSGIQMVLMALVIMLAAVSVTFLSARVAAALGHDLRDNVYRKVIHFSSNEYHKFSTCLLYTSNVILWSCYCKKDWRTGRSKNCDWT